MAIYKNYIEAFKFAGIPAFIRKLAFLLDLDAGIEVEKGFIRETTFFTIKGSPEKVDRFVSMLNESIKEYLSND
jgi:hypothetical protein